MKACVVCNRGNEAGNRHRFLDDVILNDADRGTLRDRLEGVLHEAVCQDGWVCAACQADLKRIETYYTLINDFKQQYWDTTKQQQNNNNKTTTIKQQRQEPYGQDKGLQRERVLVGDHTYNAGVSLQNSPPDVDLDSDNEQGSVSEINLSENDDTQEENEVGESVGRTYIQVAKEPHRGSNGIKGKRSSTGEDAGGTLPREGNPKDKAFPIDNNPRDNKTVGVRLYMCAACDAGFTQPRSLSAHIREVHTPHLTPTHSGRYVCNFCSKEHRTACQLVRHVRVHTGDKPYKCGLCLKVYTELGHLKDHLGLHTTHRFPCPVCQRVLGTKHSLQGHMARTHGRRVKFSPSISRLKRYKLNLTKADVVNSKVVENDQELSTSCGHVDKLTNQKATEGSFVNTKTETETVITHMHLNDSETETETSIRHTAGEKAPEELQLNERGLQLCDVYPVYVEGTGYVCSICNKTFRWPAQFARHARVHTGERRHRCGVCGRGYKEASHLKSHLDTHAGYVFSCPVCGRQHGTHVSLRLHMSKLHRGVPVPRPATFRLKQESAAQSANDTSHEDIRSAVPVPTAGAGELKQQECNTQPTCSSHKHGSKAHRRVPVPKAATRQIRELQRNVSAPKPAAFKIKQQHEREETLPLSNSKQEKHDSGNKPECTLTDDIELDMQVTEENDSEEVSTLQSEIVVCGATMDNDGDDADRSISAISGALEMCAQTKPHVCWECGKGFRNGVELKRHDLVHTGARPHQCGTCGKTYKHVSHLNTHMQGHGSLSFLCTECGLTLTTKISFNHHMQQHQAGSPHVKRAEKPLIRPSHPCAQCDKVYVSARNLEVHSRTHRGERPYSCSVCDKTFTTGSCLTQHMARHSDRRPYTCPVCDKGFKYRGQVKVHQKVHSRDTQVCADCGKRFRNQTSLINHQRSHADRCSGSTYLPLPQQPAN